MNRIDVLTQLLIPYRSDPEPQRSLYVRHRLGVDADNPFPMLQINR